MWGGNVGTACPRLSPLLRFVADDNASGSGNSDPARGVTGPGGHVPDDVARAGYGDAVLTIEFDCISADERILHVDSVISIGFYCVASNYPRTGDPICRIEDRDIVCRRADHIYPSPGVSARDTFGHEAVVDGYNPITAVSDGLDLRHAAAQDSDSI
jgi:hypothetical protein